MKLVHPLWLLGTLLAVAVAALLVAGAVKRRRATAALGDVAVIGSLVTATAARSRAWKGVLVVIATGLAFVALARPQYGRGTRLVPATNLDVVLVVDYSKSMYARDVAPSRITRAKAEISRLVRDLAGARFGAVAFAGESIAFPLTSDGAAIAQFFRQMEPNDMPVGGTAIARALERGRDLLLRDPKSKDHKRVLLLVTDGEDEEGDPVTVAKAAATDGTMIHVVQVGGRTPETIPEVGADGKITGYRNDDTGKPLTTELSAEGEAQLAQIAEVAGGRIVRAERGATGIDVIAAELKREQTEELAERVETVYADVYAWPLGAALFLLVLETFVAESKKRGVAKAALAGVTITLLAGCGHWDWKHPFDRDAPDVDRSIASLDAGDAQAATELLEDYLGTGACGDGGIGSPPRLHDRPNASLDLGLALFQVGERFGKRFGEEEQFGEAGPTPEEQELLASRAAEVECALRVALVVAEDRGSDVELRARAQYLAGNLEFLRRQYEDAVKRYDASLELVPGPPTNVPDAGDAGGASGADAAWNRAIALRRIEDEKKKDGGKDGSEDAPPDSPPDAPRDAPPDGAPDDAHDEKSQPDGGEEGGDDAGGKDDGGGDGGTPPPAPSSSAAKPPPSVSQDERVLDMLESAPTFQQQDAKNHAAMRRGRGMIDK